MHKASLHFTGAFRYATGHPFGNRIYEIETNFTTEGKLNAIRESRGLSFPTSAKNIPMKKFNSRGGKLSFSISETILQCDKEVSGNKSNY